MMAPPLPMYAALFTVFYLVLQTLHLSEQIVTLCVGFVAWLLAYVTAKGVQYVLPKKRISPTNKAVFITGCDTGFGHELAKRLDGLGFHVYAGCLFPDKDGANQLKGRCSKRLRIVQLDVTNDEQITAAVKEVEDSLGDKELWSLVNNAGISSCSEVEWSPMEMYTSMFDVNVFGPVRVTKGFLPLLRRSHGRVVIVASLASRYPCAGMSAYCMSKYAAAAFAETLRIEMFKWGITVHTIEPGIYKTPMSDIDRLLAILNANWESASPEVREEYGREYYLRYQRCLLSDLSLYTNTNVHEVVDTMVDAVSETNPKRRYVPSVLFRAGDRVFSLFPSQVQEFFFRRSLPKCRPAGVKRGLCPFGGSKED